MKKIIVTIACLLFGYHAALQAQETVKKEKFAQEIQQQLNLTPDQMEALKAIRKNAHETRKANKVTYAADKKALHQANFKLKTETETKIKAILSEPQFQKLQSIQQEKHREKVLKHAEKTATDLALNADQRTQFYAMIAERENKLLANKKTYGNNQEAMQKANQEVRKSFRESLKKILTPDQLTKLKTIMKEKKAAQGTK